MQLPPLPLLVMVDLAEILVEELLGEIMEAAVAGLMLLLQGRVLREQ
jgi:hypothetical protein